MVYKFWWAYVKSDVVFRRVRIIPVSLTWNLESIKSVHPFLYKLYEQDFWRSISMAARSKAWIGGLSLAGFADSDLPPAFMSVYCECCFLSGRGLCVGLITRPGKSYRVWGIRVGSWSLNNEEAMIKLDLLGHGKKCFWSFLRGCNVMPGLRFSNSQQH